MRIMLTLLLSLIYVENKINVFFYLDGTIINFFRSTNGHNLVAVYCIPSSPSRIPSMLSLGVGISVPSCFLVNVIMTSSVELVYVLFGSIIYSMKPKHSSFFIFVTFLMHFNQCCLWKLMKTISIRLTWFLSLRHQGHKLKDVWHVAGMAAALGEI